MNNVMRSQAEVINNLLLNHHSLEAREFMSDMCIPLDQQDRVLNAIGRLSKPSAQKIGVILELSAETEIRDYLLR